VTEPLRLDFHVACSPEHAFATWGERFALWWPRSHNASGEADARVVLEPRVGGRIYERTASGRELDWGEIVAWEPPRRLAYLWHIRWARADATEVEISFTPDAHGTRVEIVHGGWDRLGAGAAAWRDRNPGGWASLLPHCRKAAER
jgi:uncharacterized protein YndB with AHSA1/START domain